MAAIKVDVDMKNMGAVKTLTDLLVKHFDALPDELQQELKRFCDSDVYEIDNEGLLGNGLDTQLIKIVADGEELTKVSSINPILKRFTLLGQKCESVHAYPKQCLVKCGNVHVCGWGNDDPDDNIY